jgi:hypothetical protein
MLMVSLNEIQVTTRKAGQGCGLAYGLAEDLNPLIVGSTLGDRLLLGSGGADYSARGDGAGFASRLSLDPPRPPPEFAAAWDKAAAQGVAVESEPWRRLQQFAARILVPESEYSRLHGAGAGFIDRD